ncbi:uncharacterized protein DS421_9g281270 [Arachis hypogaea]|nr:uncharacterized protein DS421_9g281270 [Arachis hypogaea]
MRVLSSLPLSKQFLLTKRCELLCLAIFFVISILLNMLGWASGCSYWAMPLEQLKLETQEILIWAQEVQGPKDVTRPQESGAQRLSQSKSLCQQRKIRSKNGSKM